MPKPNDRACNSLDTLLVHPRVAAALLPEVVAQLGAAGVTFRADCVLCPRPINRWYSLHKRAILISNGWSLF